MNNTIKYLAAGLVTAAAIAVAGCGSTPAAQAPASPAAQAPASPGPAQPSEPAAGAGCWYGQWSASGGDVTGSLGLYLTTQDACAGIDQDGLLNLPAQAASGPPNGKQECVVSVQGGQAEFWWNTAQDTSQAAASEQTAAYIACVEARANGYTVQYTQPLP